MDYVVIFLTCSMAYLAGSSAWKAHRLRTRPTLRQWLSFGLSCVLCLFTVTVPPVNMFLAWVGIVALLAYAGARMTQMALLEAPNHRQLLQDGHSVA